MTFALGQVSGSNLHSLFDRNTDIAIVFSDQTRMSRNDQNQDLLNITCLSPEIQSCKSSPIITREPWVFPFISVLTIRYSHRHRSLWCSWTAYYHEAREEDIVRNTDWLAANLKPYGFQYIQIDDGYDNDTDGMKHNWIRSLGQTGILSPRAGMDSRLH